MTPYDPVSDRERPLSARPIPYPMTQTPAGPADPPSDPVAVRPGKRFRWFYVAAGLVSTAIVVGGFWPSFFGPLLDGAPGDRHWVLYVHAVVYVGWLGLFILQSTLVVRRRKDLHRRLGNAGIAYGGLVLVLGLAATLVAPPLHVASGRWTPEYAAAFLILPLGDLLLFGGFFAAATRFKNRHALHKRLMVLATVALIFPGAARMLSPRDHPLLTAVVWLSPLLAAMVVDVLRRQRIEPVYLVGGAILILGYGRVLLMQTEGWLRIGRAIMGYLT